MSDKPAGPGLAKARAKSVPVSVGEVWDLRCHTDIMVGPKALYPSGNVVNGKEGWSLIVDDELDCVWIGWDGWWTRVGWDSIRYLRYRHERPEMNATHK